MQTPTELQELCKLVRHHILTSTTHAGSGHPTSSLSAVELMTTLFFSGFFKYDIDEPHALSNDRFVLSKGHASPLLYSLFRVAGAITAEDLDTLRDQHSRLEGHPTPLFPYHDVETGSLGQGLSIGLGMCLGLRLKLKNQDVPNVFVLLGDSEFAEGQVYEALELANQYKVSNLVAILDVNRLGQRGETMLGWDLGVYKKRVESFGWKVAVIEDGHDIESIQSSFALHLNEKRNQPLMLIAKTVKGKGVSFLENKEDQHGKPVLKDKLDEALKEIGEVDKNLIGEIATTLHVKPEVDGNDSEMEMEKHYTLHEEVATRKAYGEALLELGKKDKSVVVLDAEVSNSTYAELFKKEFSDRFFEMYIAEQNMVSVAVGLSKIGYKPYVSTFAAFLTRAFDQIRMAQYSFANITFCGSHSGVSIGEDGSSQMGLEDISMFRSILKSKVLYPADASTTLQCIKLLHGQQGIGYIRTTRSALPNIYSTEEARTMKIGGSKILRQSSQDKAVVFAAGITLHEALKAHEALKFEGIYVSVVDLYSVKPIDESVLRKLSYLPFIVVEDHYPTGGIGEAVSSVISNLKLHISSFTHLCVKKIPHSGKPEENLRYQGIDAASIVKSVKAVLV